MERPAIPKKNPKNFLPPMANVDTGSAANDASVDDFLLGDEVLNTYKEYDITGEEVFAEIENLPNAAPVSETTSNDHVHNPACHHLDEDAAIDSASRSPARKKSNVNSIMHDDWEAKSVIIFNIDVKHGGKRCGIVQLSCIADDPFSDKHLSEFDKYVQPPANASWDEKLWLLIISIHLSLVF